MTLFPKDCPRCIPAIPMLINADGIVTRPLDAQGVPLRCAYASPVAGGYSPWPPVRGITLAGLCKGPPPTGPTRMRVRARAPDKEGQQKEQSAGLFPEDGRCFPLISSPLVRHMSWTRHTCVIGTFPRFRGGAERSASQAAERGKERGPPTFTAGRSDSPRARYTIASSMKRSGPV